jgi:hypothetical protein
MFGYTLLIRKFNIAGRSAYEETEINTVWEANRSGGPKGGNTASHATIL